MGDSMVRLPGTVPGLAEDAEPSPGYKGVRGGRLPGDERLPSEVPLGQASLLD